MGKLWLFVIAAIVAYILLFGTGCQHSAPRRIALPSTVPVKRAVAVAAVHTERATASNARAVAIARKAVLAGIPAGSQDATDLATDTEATNAELTTVKKSLTEADLSIEALSTSLDAKQQEIDAQTSRLAALQTKYDAAVKTIWWYRVRFWGPLTFALAALAIYLLTRFTSWGARTFGPYILGAEKVAAKAAVLV